MNKFGSLVGILNLLGHKDEANTLNKLARKSDQEYLNIAEKIIKILGSDSRGGPNSFDPIVGNRIGPTAQTYFADIPESIFSESELKFKTPLKEIMVVIHRPFSVELLQNIYGLTPRQVAYVQSNYPENFFWKDGRTGDSSNINDESSVRIDIYPDQKFFFNIENNIKVTYLLNWLHGIIYLPKIKTIFIHEISHIVNNMRGINISFDSLSEDDLIQKFNSTEEIQAVYIEIYNHINNLINANEPIVKYILANRHQDFIYSIFKQYHDIMGVDYLTEDTRNKYVSRFGQLFLEFREKILEKMNLEDASGFSQWNSKFK